MQRLYLNGRYLKLRRDISQTPFVLRDGTVMAESSVESVVATALGKVVSSDSVKFIPAGREDMDVRMLGTGRPFTVEITNPRPLTLTTCAPSSGVPSDLDLNWITGVIWISCSERRRTRLPASSFETGKWPNGTPFSA